MRMLVFLFTTAQSRAVRVWAMQLLRGAITPTFFRLHRRGNPPAVRPRRRRSAGLRRRDAAKIDDAGEAGPGDVVKLLQTRNLAALEIIARLMEQHVRADQFSLEELVELACAAPVPVGAVGPRFLQSRRIESPASATISLLSNARSAGVAGEITTWALSILGAAVHYDVDAVSRFFDSLLQPAREAAWSWLTSQSAGYNDPALLEPADRNAVRRLRFDVVGELQRRATLPGASHQQITFVWTTVLLNIHRGGRSKLAALKQISRAIVDHPARAEPLLPVLAVAVRSGADAGSANGSIGRRRRRRDAPAARRRRREISARAAALAGGGGMNVTFAYAGHSQVVDRPGRQTFQLVPNLTGDPSPST